MDRLEQGRFPPRDTASRLKWQLDREATLWVLARTLYAQKQALDLVIIERIASLVNLPIQHAVATTYCSYCIAMNVLAARAISEANYISYFVV